VPRKPFNLGITFYGLQRFQQVTRFKENGVSRNQKSVYGKQASVPRKQTSVSMKHCNPGMQFCGLPHESTQANIIKPFNRIKGRNSLVTLRRSHLRWLRVPFVEKPIKVPFILFASVDSCGTAVPAGDALEGD